MTRNRKPELLNATGMLLYALHNARSLTCSVCGRPFVVDDTDAERFIIHETACMRKQVITNVVDNVIEYLLSYNLEIKVSNVTLRASMVLAPSYDDMGEMEITKEVRKQLRARNLLFKNPEARQ